MVTIIGQALSHKHKELTSVKVAPDWKEGHVQCNVSHGGIRLEDRNDCELDKHEEHRVLPRREKTQRVRGCGRVPGNWI